MDKKTMLLVSCFGWIGLVGVGCSGGTMSPGGSNHNPYASPDSGMGIPQVSSDSSVDSMQTMTDTTIDSYQPFPDSTIDSYQNFPDSTIDSYQNFPDTTVDSANLYNSNEIWTDPTSGLMWQIEPDGWNGWMSSSKTWTDARNSCADLSLDGYTDWRLPTISELRSLIRGCNKTETGAPCGVTDACLDGTCHNGECAGCLGAGGPASGCYWPSEMKGMCHWYWTSSSVADSTSRAWYISFSGGIVFKTLKNHTLNFRCVR